MSQSSSVHKLIDLIHTSFALIGCCFKNIVFLLRASRNQSFQQIILVYFTLKSLSLQIRKVFYGKCKINYNVMQFGGFRKPFFSMCGSCVSTWSHILSVDSKIVIATPQNRFSCIRCNVQKIVQNAWIEPCNVTRSYQLQVHCHFAVVPSLIHH